MTLDKFTIKAQEAVQEAVNIAQSRGQQAIEPVHLLKGVMSKDKDVTNFIFRKLGVILHRLVYGVFIFAKFVFCLYYYDRLTV